MDIFKFHKLTLLVGIYACTQPTSAQLLKGHINANLIPEVQINFSIEGSPLTYTSQDLAIKEDGSFTFDMKLPKRTMDTQLYVNDDIFGVHLETGKTTVVQLIQDAKTKHWEIRFSGDNVDVNKFYNSYADAMEMSHYYSMDPGSKTTNTEYRQKLDNAYKLLTKKIDLINNKQLRTYYTHLSERTYTWNKIRLIMDDAEDHNKKYTDYPEYNQAIQSIDINDPINVPANLAIAWLNAQPKKAPASEDLTELSLEEMDIIDQNITQPEVRRLLTYYIGMAYFSYGKNKETGRFMKRYKEFANEYPLYYNQFQALADSQNNVQTGKQIPYDPQLTKTDGTTCKLSDLFGKFIYIDIWATWCAPCCKEIPHLEKLVNHFKENDKLTIISISADQNKEAWIKKLEKDKPDWPQFILSREDEQKFMAAWNINGIPRFIMLNQDGTIAEADAIRPSSPNIIQTIEGHLK